MSALRAMIHNLKSYVETHMIAATFAQADDRETAMKFLQKRDENPPEIRSRDYQRKKPQQMEERARLHT